MGSRRSLPALLCLALLATSLSATSAGAAGKKPDLIVTTLTASPTSAFAGDPIEIETTTQNKGKATASGSTTSIYLSKDGTRGPGDKALKRTHSVPKLKPGKSARATLQGVVPASVAPGEYNLIACADSKKKVAESKESNNCRVATSGMEVAAATSDHLIEDAVEAGEIDEGEALEYRVFAQFNDPRLPARFEGDDSTVMESDALIDAATSFTDLSPDAQATLAPFLIPPYHAGSYWSGESASAARSGGVAEPPAETPWCDGSLIMENWHSLDTLNGKVRVWWQQRYNDTDRAEAEQIVDAIDDKIWPRLTSLMGREPLSDASTFGCDGGDGKLDIALVDARTATTVPATLFGCRNTAGHILFDRGRANLLPYVAHEIMHAIQYSYAISGSCDEYKWLREATAQWVQDYISDPAYGVGLAPDDTEWEHSAPEKFLDHPEVPLESVSPPDNHDYGAYVFFFYLARVSNPSVIPEIWNNTTSMNSLEAIKPVIGGDWGPVWKEFAKYNWNQGSLDNYKDWDGLTSQAAVQDSGTLAKGETKFKVGVKHLSSKYFTFVPQEKLTSLDFINNSVGTEGAGVQAVIKYKDGTDKVEDWSDKEKVNLCLEDPAVESVTLIFTNSNSAADNKITYDVAWNGLTDLCCTAQPSARAGAAEADCEGDGNVTWTYSHTAEGPGGWEHVSYTYDATAQMTFDFEALEDDPNTYVDTGNSSFTYSGSGVEERNRGYSEGCEGDVVEKWEYLDDLSSTFRSAESEPQAWAHDDGTLSLSAIPWYDRTTNYTLKCGSEESTGTGHSDLYGAAFVVCPQEPFNFGVTLQQTAETETTRTYSIDCSSTETYERDNMTHTETVGVAGSITLHK